MTLDELRARATGERDGYRLFDGDLRQMAVTLEDAEFLHALVRLAKPGRVLELGTGHGVSARFMAEALKDNGGGLLVTVEPDAALRDSARRLLADLPALVTSAPRDAAPFDLVFIDSSYRTRGDDIEDWLGNGYTGLVCVHDAHRDYPQLEGGAGVFLPGVDGLWLGRPR